MVEPMADGLRSVGHYTVATMRKLLLNNLSARSPAVQIEPAHIGNSFPACIPIKNSEGIPSESLCRCHPAPLLAARGCGRFLGLDYAAGQRLCRCSAGLRPPRDNLIRFWLYQLMYWSTKSMNCWTLTSFQGRS